MLNDQIEDVYFDLTVAASSTGTSVSGQVGRSATAIAVGVYFQPGILRSVSVTFWVGQDNAAPTVSFNNDRNVVSGLSSSPTLVGDGLYPIWLRTNQKVGRGEFVKMRAINALASEVRVGGFVRLRYD